MGKYMEKKRKKFHLKNKIKRLCNYLINFSKKKVLRTKNLKKKYQNGRKKHKHTKICFLKCGELLKKKLRINNLKKKSKIYKPKSYFRTSSMILITRLLKNNSNKKKVLKLSLPCKLSLTKWDKKYHLKTN